MSELSANEIAAIMKFMDPVRVQALSMAIDLAKHNSTLLNRHNSDKLYSTNEVVEAASMLEKYLRGE